MSIPIPTIKRFPSYLRILKQAKDSGKKYISATTLAEELDLNPIQVRKDISSTGIEGKPKIGFDIEELTQYITHVLGWDNTSDALIVGAGNLGSAIARYDGFASYGLKIVAVFDKSAEKIGTTIGSFTVKSMEIKPVSGDRETFSWAETGAQQLVLGSVPGNSAHLYVKEGYAGTAQIAATVEISVKGGSTWNKDFGKNLLKLRKLSPKFNGGYVIYSGDLTPEVDGVKFLNFKNTAATLV